MAQITISDILGSDAMSASRAVIMRNFKILADEANKIETYLNTSPVGGELSIGNITVTSTDTSNTILNVQAGAQIDGRLEVGKDLQCNSNASVTGTLTIGANDSAVVLNGDSGSQFGSAAFNELKLNQGFYSVVKSEDYKFDISGKSMIELKYTNSGSPAGSPAEAIVYNLFGAEEGQVLVILFTGDSHSGTFRFASDSSLAEYQEINITCDGELKGTSATFIFHKYTNTSTLEIVPLAHEGVNIEII